MVKKFFLLQVAINTVLVLILIAGAVVSFNLGTFDQKRDETGEYEYGGPKKPGRFVSSLPDWQRTIIHQLDADKEGNVATYITALNFLVLAFLFLLLSSVFRETSKWRKTGFIAAGTGFFVVSLEEIISLHSFLDGSRKAVDNSMSGLWTFAGAEYVLFLFPLIIGAGFLTFLIWKSFPIYRSARRLGLIALGMFSMALLIDGLFHNVPNNLYRIVGMVEESLEIAGAMILIFSTWLTIQHIRENKLTVRSGIQDSS